MYELKKEKKKGKKRQREQDLKMTLHLQDLNSNCASPAAALEQNLMEMAKEVLCEKVFDHGRVVLVAPDRQFCDRA